MADILADPALTAAVSNVKASIDTVDITLSNVEVTLNNIESTLNHIDSTLNTINLVQNLGHSITSTINTKSGLFSIVDDTEYLITVICPDTDANTKFQYAFRYYRTSDIIGNTTVLSDKLFVDPRIENPIWSNVVVYTEQFLSRETAYISATNFCYSWSADTIQKDLNNIQDNMGSDIQTIRSDIRALTVHGTDWEQGTVSTGASWKHGHPDNVKLLEDALKAAGRL